MRDQACEIERISHKLQIAFVRIYTHALYSISITPIKLYHHNNLNRILWHVDNNFIISNYRHYIQLLFTDDSLIRLKKQSWYIAVVSPPHPLPW